MTVFVDPYHTSMGRITDLTRTSRLLIETTIRDPIKGTNLGLATDRGVVPVFITGCRDSERSLNLPPFAHPIFSKNSKGDSYLFSDMTPFIQAQSSLENIEAGIRRRDQYDFVWLRTMLSLAWVTGDRHKLRWPAAMAGDVYAQTIAQLVGRQFQLDFTDQIKVQAIALAFYYSLFEEGTVHYAEDDDLRALVARRFSSVWKPPLNPSTTEVDALLKKVPPMGNLRDFCDAVVAVVDSSRLKPDIPGKPNARFNEAVLLQLIASVWHSHNSAQILATAMEHPPTWIAIVYFCITYNNFRKQTLGSVAQMLMRSGDGNSFVSEIKRLQSDYSVTTLRPVMEYLNPLLAMGNLD